MTEKLQKELAIKLQALSADQRDRLHHFLDVLLACKEGQITEADVVHSITDLPQESLIAFTDILSIDDDPGNL